jgi:hypothetical protein
MFRRVFWFLLGAVCGVLGVAWARRKTDELREAITVESVARLAARTALAAWRQLRVAVTGIVGLVDDDDRGDAPVPASTTSTTQRRHIAPQPRSTHR